jgi:hypothetical protein
MWPVFYFSKIYRCKQLYILHRHCAILSIIYNNKYTHLAKYNKINVCVINMRPDTIF